MEERTATIRNEAGMHCRPSAAIAKELSTFRARVQVIARAGVAETGSMMSLLALGLEKGSRVTVRAEGRDEKAAADKAVELLETEFDFPPREDA